MMVYRNPRPKLNREWSGMGFSAPYFRPGTGRNPLLLFFLSLCLSAARPAAGGCGDVFPIPSELKPNVAFWVDVFTKYTKDQAILHDNEVPLRIYSIVDVKGLSRDIPGERKKRDSLIERETKQIISLLKRLADPERTDTMMTAQELKIRVLFDGHAKPGDFLKAAENIRSQGGLRESFTEGLIRSGRYMDAVRRIFEDRGLPGELVYLPHVESSYNWRAVSKAGAVGVWQFTKSTGRIFLTVDDAIDERRDPLLSADAAARLLKRNYEVTGKWPLAVTAYNHGLLSIRRAMDTLATDDLMRIIRSYDHKPFGFASKNFYAEFLAAVEVAENPSPYFGDLIFDPPVEFRGEELPVPVMLAAAQRAFHCGRDTLAALNPAFLPAVLNGRMAIPRGYRLRLPADADVAAAYETLTSEGYLPRGACRAWCKGSEKDLFRLIESTGRPPNAFEPHT
jgi:membrane-bound lytic murein transglycosylase D